MTRPPPTPTDDYDLIEAAVMDTARGRWFLAEFLRRHRSADTVLLLEAIERLEARLAAATAIAPPTPHEPAAEPEPHGTADTELLAIGAPPPPDFMLSSLPDDVAWLGNDDDVQPMTAGDIVEIDDESLVLPPPSHEDVAAEQAVPDDEPPPRFASSQSVMLATALGQTVQSPSIAPESSYALPSAGGTPMPADPADLDALTFEEKSVYFA